VTETSSFDLQRLLPGDIIAVQNISHDFVIAVAVVHVHAVVGVLSEMSEGELVDTASVAILGSCIHNASVAVCPFSSMLLIEGESVLMSRKDVHHTYYLQYVRVERGGDIIFEAGKRP
jgi:hypothetical protein